MTKINSENLKMAIMGANGALDSWLETVSEQEIKLAIMYLVEEQTN